MNWVTIPFTYIEFWLYINLFFSLQTLIWNSNFLITALKMFPHGFVRKTKQWNQGWRHDRRTFNVLSKSIDYSNSLLSTFFSVGSTKDISACYLIIIDSFSVSPKEWSTRQETIVLFSFVHPRLHRHSCGFFSLVLHFNRKSFLCLYSNLK